MTSTSMTRTAEKGAAGSELMALLERSRAAAGASLPAWRGELRRAAAEAFGRLGLPTRRHEDWRYTNLAPLAKGSFVPVQEGPTAIDRAAIESAFVGGDDVLRLVLVDGHFAPELSRLGDGDGAVGELGALLAASPELRERLGSLARVEDDGVVALATALLADGACVVVPRGVTCAQPIQILHVSGASRPDALVAPRTLVVLGEDSRATLLETHLALGSAPAATLGVVELLVGPAAHLEHHRLLLGNAASFHLGSSFARLERGSHLISGLYTFGGALARDGMRVALAGEGADCTLRGLYTADGEGHADCDLLLDHELPHGTSRQEYRGLLDGRGRGTFHGRVIVRQDAQKSEARQSNRNLLLSRDARADTRPQLEIFADDVQCSHGATIGQLDADALFYLRTRGLDEPFARHLLSRAFAAAVSQEITWPALRERVEQELDRFLHASVSLPADAHPIR